VWQSIEIIRVQPVRAAIILQDGIASKFASVVYGVFNGVEILRPAQLPAAALTTFGG